MRKHSLKAPPAAAIARGDGDESTECGLEILCSIAMMLQHTCKRCQMLHEIYMESFKIYHT